MSSCAWGREMVSPNPGRVASEVEKIPKPENPTATSCHSSLAAGASQGLALRVWVSSLQVLI